MKLSRIDHVALAVRNLEASFEWYSRVIGFTILHKWAHTWMIQFGDSRIGLFSRPGAASISDLDNTIAIQHFAFLTDAKGFENCMSELNAKSVPFEGPEDTGIAKSLLLTDPDGHSLEITYYHTPTR